MKFNACKHLIFDRNRMAKTVNLAAISSKQITKAVWERIDPEGRPALCQFCDLRGRLNFAEACLDEEKKRCSGFEDAERFVPDEDIDKYPLKIS